MNRGMMAVLALLWCGAMVVPAVRADDAEKPSEGPPFPRIATMAGVSLYPDRDDSGLAGGEPLTLEEIARYDLIVGVYGGPWREPEAWPVLRKRLASLKEANPHLIVIGPWMSATSSLPDPTAVPHGTVYWRTPPEDAWVCDVNGNRVPISGPGRFVLDLTKESVLDWLAQCCADQVRNHGYDGVCLGGMDGRFPDFALSRSSPGYTVDLTGDGQAEALDVLHAKWREAERTLCDKIRQAAGGDTVVLQGGGMASDYLLDSLNGWGTGTPLLHIMRRPERWEQEVERYIRWTQTPHRPNVTVLSSVPDRSAPPESHEDQLRRMRFGLTTTLLGDGYFCFSADGRERWHPEFEAPLGYPLNRATDLPSGLWQREFQGGVVAVNPTAGGASIGFPADHRDVSTGEVGKEFTLASMDGRIFTPAE